MPRDFAKKHQGRCTTTTSGACTPQPQVTRWLEQPYVGPPKPKTPMTFLAQ
eukprot:jgi/Botrbrau1/17046/Bobra.49_2s0102.1